MGTQSTHPNPTTLSPFSVIFPFSGLGSVLYSRCYGPFSATPTQSCAKSKSPMHIFFPYSIVCCHVALFSVGPMVGQILTSHVREVINPSKLPNKLDENKLIQCT